jgi:hypothetical protein
MISNKPHTGTTTNSTKRRHCLCWLLALQHVTNRGRAVLYIPMHAAASSEQNAAQTSFLCINSTCGQAPVNTTQPDCK